MPFEPNDELTVRLTAAEWNAVLGTLQDGIYKVVAGIIVKINQQCQEQLAGPKERADLRAVPRDVS